MAGEDDADAPPKGSQMLSLSLSFIAVTENPRQNLKALRLWKVIEPVLCFDSSCIEGLACDRTFPFSWRRAGGMGKAGANTGLQVEGAEHRFAKLAGAFGTDHVKSQKYVNSPRDQNRCLLNPG